MLLTILKSLISIALQFLTKEQLKKFAAMAFSFIKDAVKESDNPYDDAIVLPMIERLEAAFDIPDELDDE